MARDDWKATTALRMFSPKPPSISPGENQARSRRICARTTAGPREPVASVGDEEASPMLVASRRSTSIPNDGVIRHLVRLVVVGARRDAEHLLLLARGLRREPSLRGLRRRVE